MDSIADCHCIRNTGDVLPSLLREFLGFFALVSPLLKGNYGQPLCRYLVWHREGEKILSHLIRGEGVHGLHFHP